MKKIRFASIAATIVFAGISLVACKGSTETEGGETMGTETGTGYDETQAPAGEQGSDAMNPGADGETGTVNDTTTTGGSNTSAQGTNTTTGGAGTTATGSGAAGGTNSSNRP